MFIRVNWMNLDPVTCIGTFLLYCIVPIKVRTSKIVFSKISDRLMRTQRSQATEIEKENTKTQKVLLPHRRPIHLRTNYTFCLIHFIHF
jgi:hypothetical protein